MANIGSEQTAAAACSTRLAADDSASRDRQQTYVGCEERSDGDSEAVIATVG